MSTLRIQVRRGTAAQWTAANPILFAGETGFETDTEKFKIGDGTTAWTSLGYQNISGVQGTQGTQGVQGVQGEQGIQGTQGVQGVQGTLGTQGLTGAFGGETFEYNYLTNTTDSDPGSGNFKFNNATFSSATVLYIDPLDVNAVDITSFLNTIDDSTSSIKGTIKVTDVTDPLNYAFFQIIGVHSGDHVADGYFTVPIAYVSGPLTLSADENVTMTFARVGDKGDQGIQGTLGTQGTEGTQGTAGVAPEGGITTEEVVMGVWN